MIVPLSSALSANAIIPLLVSTSYTWMHVSLCACMCPSPHAVAPRASDAGSNAISSRSRQSKVERQLPWSSRLHPDESINPPRKKEKRKTAKLLPTEPEWVMYYWCFEDMYRTKIFTWVTMWRAIFERVFLRVKAHTSEESSRPASGITIPLERRCCVGRELIFQALPSLTHKVDGINCLPGVGEQCVCSLTDQQSLQGAALPLTQ